MHQRQASSFGRKVYYGRQTIPIVHDLTALGQEPGIGLIRPEFDDLKGGEQDVVEDLENHEAKAAE